MVYWNSGRPGVRVIIKETGEEFNSIRACADHLDVDPGWLSKVVRGADGLCTCHGYHVVTTDDPRIDRDIEQIEHRGRKGKRVRIVETGERFDSISDCAKAINGSVGTIHDVLYGNRNRTTYKGLHFELD